MVDFRTGIQVVINSLDEGPLRTALRMVLLAFLSAALFGAYGWSQFHGLSEREAMDAAQVARRLATGHGFTTACLRPLDVWQFQRHGGSVPRPTQWPELRQGPVYPAVLAAGFRMSRPPERVPDGPGFSRDAWRVILPLGWVFTFLSALAAFVLARKLFDPAAAWLAMLLVPLNVGFLDAAVSGRSLVVAAFLVTAAVCTALHAVAAREARRTWLIWFSLVLVTALLGAAVFLTRYALFVVPLVLLVWMFRAFDGWRWVVGGVLVLVFAAAVAPWLLRNRDVSGNWLGLAPYGALHDTVLYPDDALDRMPDPVLSRPQVTAALRIKLKQSMGRIARAHAGLPAAGVVGALFVLALLQRHDQRETETLKWHLVAAFLALALAAGMGASGTLDLVVVLFPVLTVYAAAAYLACVRRLANYADEFTQVLSVVLLLVVALPVCVTLAGPRKGIPYPPYYPPLVRFVTDTVGTNEVLCTDIPWATAWYGDRPSCLLPRTVTDMAPLADSLGPWAGIYLARTPSPRTWNDRSWWDLWRRQVPEGFGLTHGVSLPPGTDDQLFLSDRPRWQGRQEM